MLPMDERFSMGSPTSARMNTIGCSQRARSPTVPRVYAFTHNHVLWMWAKNYRKQASSLNVKINRWQRLEHNTSIFRIATHDVCFTHPAKLLSHLVPVRCRRQTRIRTDCDIGIGTTIFAPASNLEPRRLSKSASGTTKCSQLDQSVLSREREMSRSSTEEEHTVVSSSTNLTSAFFFMSPCVVLISSRPYCRYNHLHGKQSVRRAVIMCVNRFEWSVFRWDHISCSRMFLGAQTKGSSWWCTYDEGLRPTWHPCIDHCLAQGPLRHETQKIKHCTSILSSINFVALAWLATFSPTCAPKNSEHRGSCNENGITHRHRDTEVLPLWDGIKTRVHISYLVALHTARSLQWHTWFYWICTHTTLHFSKTLVSWVRKRKEVFQQNRMLLWHYYRRIF